jgi:hypothetical protein
MGAGRSVDSWRLVAERRGRGTSNPTCQPIHPSLMSASPKVKRCNFGCLLDDARQPTGLCLKSRQVPGPSASHQTI